MTASRKYTLIWLLLPLLALRGLVPAGFMVDTSGGAFSIVMCGGDGPLAIAAPNEHSGHATDHDQTAHDHMDHGHMDHDQMAHANHHDGHEKHKNSICPFAMAGSAATVANISSVPVDIEPGPFFAATDIVAFHGLSGPSRAQQSRAPPHFSLVS
jgi:hypothetical protein